MEIGEVVYLLVKWADYEGSEVLSIHRAESTAQKALEAWTEEHRRIYEGDIPGYLHIKVECWQVQP